MIRSCSLKSRLIWEPTRRQALFLSWEICQNTLWLTSRETVSSVSPCTSTLRVSKKQDSLSYSYTFIRQNEHCDWLILGHVPLIKFKCIPTGIQLRCFPRDHTLSVYCYIARLSFNNISTVLGWFLVTYPWSNSNVSRPGFNYAVGAHTLSLFFAIWFLKGKSKCTIFTQISAALD